MPKKDADLSKTIGIRIAHRRRELGWTQAQVAERAGLSHQFYACAERGLKGIGMDSIIKICKTLEISADYLLTGAMPAQDKSYIIKMLEIMDETQRQATEEIIKNVLIACGYEVPKKNLPQP